MDPLRKIPETQPWGLSLCQGNGMRLVLPLTIRPGLKCLLERRDGNSAAPSLGAIQSGIGLSDQLFVGLPIGWIDDSTDAGCDANLIAVDVAGFTQTRTDFGSH